jgi:hypothetical protein
MGALIDRSANFVGTRVNVGRDIIAKGTSITGMAVSMLWGALEQANLNSTMPVHEFIDSYCIWSYEAN